MGLIHECIHNILVRPSPKKHPEYFSRPALFLLGRWCRIWQGSLLPRVQGPTFLIEYDNTQNESNHSHSVWRNFERDFGLDLLALHLRGGPHGSDPQEQMARMPNSTATKRPALSSLTELF